MAFSNAEALARIGEASLKKDETLLTPALLERKQRMETAFRMLISGDIAEADVQEHIMNHYGLDVAAALETIRDAKMVWGDVTKGHRAMDQHIAFRRAEQVFFHAKKLLDKVDEEKVLYNEDGDRVPMGLKPKDVLGALDTMLHANAQMARIKGVDKEEAQLIDPARLEASTYVLQLSARANAIMEKLANGGGGRIDLGAMLKDIPEAEVVEIHDPTAPDTKEP